jgi:WXXGXW repeat (2 copies)
MKRSGYQVVSGLVLGVLMLAVSVVSLSTTSSAQIGIGIGISVRIGPPALPVYAQPICPGPGYLWTPGYWAWSDDGGYYWVPGTWVVAPVGMLWTPGYWGFAGGVYGWHAGYWGPHVGFYGGINYGFGYGGVGFAGGEWRGGAFFYNRAVMNVNVTNVRNVYSRTVIVNNTHVAFNGLGGVEARPTPQEEMYAHEGHTPALAAQTEHEHAASQNKHLFASENHGRPAIAATAKPGDFSGRNVTRASAAGGAYHEPKTSPQQARAEPARNEPTARTDRPAARPENSEARSSRPSNTEARENQARSNQARTSPTRSSEAGNRQTAAHQSAKPESTKPAAKQEKQASKKAAAKPAKAEPKGNGKEERHR